MVMAVVMVAATAAETAVAMAAETVAEMAAATVAETAISRYSGSKLTVNWHHSTCAS